MTADPDSLGDAGASIERALRRCPECGAEAGLERTPAARSWRDWRRVWSLVIAALVGAMYLAAGLLASESWNDVAPPPPMALGTRTVVELVGADGITRDDLRALARLDKEDGLLTHALSELAEVEARFPDRARVWFGYLPHYGEERSTRSFGWPVRWYRETHRRQFDDWQGRVPSEYSPDTRSQSFADLWFSLRGLGGGESQEAFFHLQPLLLAFAIVVLGGFGIRGVANTIPRRLSRRIAPAVIAGFILILLGLNAIAWSSLESQSGRTSVILPMTGRTYSVFELERRVPEGPRESALAGLLLEVVDHWFQPGRQVLYYAVLYPTEVEERTRAWSAPFWFPIPGASSTHWVDTKTNEVLPIGRSPDGWVVRPLPQRIRLTIGHTRYEVHVAWGYLVFAGVILLLVYGSMRFILDVLGRQQDRKRRRAGRCVICGYQLLDAS